MTHGENFIECVLPRVHRERSVLAMQQAANYTLITADEEARIRELWTQGAYPRGWSGSEPVGDLPYERVGVESTQLLLPSVTIDVKKSARIGDTLAAGTDAIRLTESEAA